MKNIFKAATLSTALGLFPALDNGGVMAQSQPDRNTQTLAYQPSTSANDNATSYVFNAKTKPTGDEDKDKKAWMKAGDHSKSGRSIGLAVIKGQSQKHIPDSVFEEYFNEKVFQAAGVDGKVFVEQGTGKNTVYRAMVHGNDLWGYMDDQELKSNIQDIVDYQKGLNLRRAKGLALTQN